MSLSAEEVRKAEGVPGAFPSEDTITKSELNNASNTTPATTGASRQNIAHTSAGAGNTFGSTANPADSDPDHLLRRAGAEGVPASGATSSATQGLGSHHNSDSVLGNAAGASTSSVANPLSGPTTAAGDGFGAENAPNITEDLKALGSGAATAATAVGIAARDAALAVKDAAAPVVSSASEQVGESGKDSLS